MAVLNAAPYGSGILAKGLFSYARYAYKDANREMVGYTRQVMAICGRHAVPFAAAAMQSSMRDPRVTVTITGMTKPQYIPDTIDLARRPIPDALWENLSSVKVDMSGPKYAE